MQGPKSRNSTSQGRKENGVRFWAGTASLSSPSGISKSSVSSIFDTFHGGSGHFYMGHSFLRRCRKITPPDIWNVPQRILGRLSVVHWRPWRHCKTKWTAGRAWNKVTFHALQYCRMRGLSWNTLDHRSVARWSCGIRSCIYTRHEHHSLTVYFSVI